jgi:hypothetical protein
MKEMVLTAAGQGEQAGNFKSFGEQDLVAGSWVYRGEQGIEYVLGRKSDFLFRFGTRRFHVYNLWGGKVNAPGRFKGLKLGEDALL